MSNPRLRARHEFCSRLAEALGVNPSAVNKITLTIRAGGLISVETEGAVFDNGQLETVINQYKFEPVPKGGGG